MDSKRSGVTDASKKQFRAVLPRQTDLMSDTLELLAQAQQAEAVFYMVLDAVDAYWQLLLHPNERRFFCAVLRRPGKQPTYLVFNRTPQGSRGAPLSWTAIFGLVCRLAFSTLRCPVQPNASRMEVYVDDPICALLGTREGCMRQVAILVLSWAALGISLALPKGQFGTTANWIGATFESKADRVTGTIQQQRLDELQQMAAEIRRQNVCTLKLLRTFTGKAQSIASLIYTWRPFVHMLYGAIYGPPSDAPTNCIWTRQIVVPLQWIQAFLAGTKGNLVRTMTLDSHLRRGQSVIITTDASPYGLGAILTIDGTIVSYLADVFCEVDKQVLGLSIELCSVDQQALEALTILVALREWVDHWRSVRLVLCIRTDNIAALTMVARMQPHSLQLAIIAREVALDVASAMYTPDIVEHVPGVANVAADALSRLNDPTKAVALPSYLSTVPRHACTARQLGWWRALPAAP